MTRIYLAGPDVFLPDARRVGERKQAICREFGFEGLFPLDNDEIGEALGGSRADAIFRANCARMARADVGVFNLTPFRGPSADAGTVFELGFLFGRGKPVYGYTNATACYLDRAKATHGPLARRDGQRFDVRGHAVEDFALADNLMIARSIEESGGTLSTVAQPGGPDAPEALAAFVAFRACLASVRARIVPRGAPT